MLPTNELGRYTKYAFILGFLVAVLIGFVYFTLPLTGKLIVGFLLVLIGVLAGTLSIPREDEERFLVAVITLLTAAVVGLQGISMIKGASAALDIIPFYAVGPALIYIGVLLAPAAVVVALRIVFRSLTKVN